VRRAIHIPKTLPPHEALNLFIEAYIDLERDANGSVVRSRGLAKISEDGVIQLNKYLGAQLSTDTYRLGPRAQKTDKVSARVKIAVNELLEAYQAGGLDAVLTLRKWQWDEVKRKHDAHIESIKPRLTLNELRARRVA